MSRVLITGGGGFLGQKLAQALAKAGTIRGNAISDLVLADVVLPAAVEAEFSVTRIVSDMADADAVDRLWGAGFDVVYHLAAVVSGAAEAR